jgi:hypothetical protein
VYKTFQTTTLAAILTFLAFPCAAIAAPQNVTFTVPVNVTLGPNVLFQDGTTAGAWNVFCAVYTGGANTNELAQGQSAPSTSSFTGTLTIVATPLPNWQNNPSLQPTNWLCTIWLYNAGRTASAPAVNSKGIDFTKSVIQLGGTF